MSYANQGHSLFGLMVALFAAAAQAESGEQAQPAPALAAQPLDEQIVVNGTLPEVSSDIDRKVYSVRADPQAQSGPILDALGRVPSVTVTPSGGLLLLGNPGVTVLIDGRPMVAPNALRTLPGSQVDRIEVMSNPSARNSAQGTAGIINIVTRTAAQANLSGSALANIDTQGAGGFNISPTLRQGDWTWSGALGWSRDQSEAQSLVRRRFTASGDETLEGDKFHAFGEGVNGSIRATYAASPKTELSFGVEGFHADFAPHDDRRITGAGFGFEPYSELVRTRGPLDSQRATFEYRWTGDHEGEGATFAAYAGGSRSRTTQTIIDDFDAATSTDNEYRLQASSRIDDDSLKLDYRNSWNDTVRLEAGVSLDRSDETIEQAQETLRGAPRGPDYDQAISGERETFASYVSTQFPFAAWAIKPGLRFESERLRIGAGPGSANRNDQRLFPSVFFERELSDALKLNLSYSQRISRPSLQMLNPAVTFSNATAASAGNPNLRPQTTDAFEVQLNYTKPGLTFGLTVYDRETEDLFSEFNQLLSNGVLLTTNVNAGRSASRGAEISWRAPLSQRWRYVVTANLFSREQTLLSSAGTEQTDTLFSYTGSAQLDYRGREHNGLNGDQLQFSVRYAGPRQVLQGRIGGFARADLVWRRALTSRASATFSVTDVFDSVRTRTRVATPDLTEETINEDVGRVVKFALSYQLGTPQH